MLTNELQMISDHCVATLLKGGQTRRKAKKKHTYVQAYITQSHNTRTLWKVSWVLASLLEFSSVTMHWTDDNERLTHKFLFFHFWLLSSSFTNQSFWLQGSKIQIVLLGGPFLSIKNVYCLILLQKISSVTMQWADDNERLTHKFLFLFGLLSSLLQTRRFLIAWEWNPNFVVRGTFCENLGLLCFLSIHSILGTCKIFLCTEHKVDI